MYECLTDQGTYFIRITNYKTYEEQLEEVTYTNFLYENGLAVPPIIPSLQGNFVEKLTLDKEIFAVLYKAAPGIHLPKYEWDSKIFKSLVNKLENYIVFLKALKRLNPLNI